MSAEFYIVLAGAIAAGFVQGLSGFAFSLVALSIWAWGIEPTLAAPLAVFGSLIGQVTTWPLTRRGYSWDKLWPFLAGGLLGVPIGAWILQFADPRGFKLGLGLFLILYCPVALFLPPTLLAKAGGKFADAVAGWLGGIMGGIGGMAGSVPSLWVNLRGWDKDSQRGVLQTFYIAMHVTTLISYFLAGNIITKSTLGWFALIAPALAIPALGGAMLFHRLDTQSFRRLVLALLFLSGVALVSASSGIFFAR